jgi:hypothetical protein
MYIKHVPLTVFSAILTLKNMHYMCMLTSLFSITDNVSIIYKI